MTKDRSSPKLPTDADLLARFQADVLRPLLGLAPADPEGVQGVVRGIRAKLDLLDELLADDGDRAPGAAGSLHVSHDAGAANGVGAGRPGNGHDPGHVEFDEFGRNQRSRLREMALLEALSSEARPFSLNQLLQALDAQGFSDAGAAVVSQLHRMKKVGTIEQPANGMYEITQDGLGHLRKLRTSFGALVKG